MAAKKTAEIAPKPPTVKKGQEWENPMTGYVGKVVAFTTLRVNKSASLEPVGTGRKLHVGIETLQKKWKLRTP